MQIIFSDHALARLKERHISKLQVFVTIKKPQQKLKSYRNRLIFRRLLKAKALEVVAKKDGDVIIVISAYMVK